MTFQDLNLNTPLYNALEDLKFQTPTPIQEKAFSSIMSGKDVVGIAQTGTGKTAAFAIPMIQLLEEKHPCRFPAVAILPYST